MTSRTALTTILSAAAWLCLVAGLSAGVLGEGGSPAGVVFCVASALLWMPGLRTAALWMRSAARPVPAPASLTGPRRADADLRIALLYCVTDDVDLRAIAASMRQDRPVDTVILDDSGDSATQRRIDLFAARSGCRVIRRSDRAGYKAGNLNHALSVLRGQFDAYVICDSDVVLPTEFARVAAGALADPAVAVAQGAPDARGGRTWFARYFGPLLTTHVAMTRRGREAHGVVAFLGRGAMVRATALDAVGGFPTAVAEDLSLTAALRRHGWRLVNVDLSFREDYPVDYRSFRTQTRKTAEGAVEFLRRPGHLRGLPLRERIDLLLDVSMVPVTALAGVTALMSGSVLAANGEPPPVWALAVSALSALAPLLPEAVARGRTERIPAALMFVGLGGALYASSMFVMLGAVLRTVGGGRAVFWTTPKTARRLGLRQVLVQLGPELILAPPLMVATMLVSGMPLSAVGLLWPLVASLAFLYPAMRAVAVLPVDRPRRERRLAPLRRTENSLATTRS
ncbi:glycosyltransferase family 2 protein [Microbacterium sp. 179-B 1A2 NHS]|uniref:glycosyltransferase family 2 protein n=1 Tax=Microbacterium sp. 179-B 1A2 NHS TaxID=3142383 RepID=UPI0039A3E1D9